MSINAKDIDRQLALVKKQWKAAQDPTQKAALHQQAESLRAGGASEAVANILLTGRAEGEGLQYAQQYMGASYDPSKDLASRLSTATSGATATSPTYSAPTLTTGTAQKVDTKPLYQAIEQYKSTPLQAQTPQTFSGQQLSSAIGQQQTAGQAPAANQAQFATPEQFGAYVNQTAQMLQPYTDQQK